MAIDCREVRTSFNCESCYEITLENCSESININPGLTHGNNYFLNIFDQFDIKRTQDITIKQDGSFDIDLSLLPDSYFNPFGGYDLNISSDEEGQVLIPLIFEGIEYTCVILIVIDPVEEIGDFSSDFSNDFS